MRRPLAWLCLLFVAGTAAVRAAGERDSVPLPILAARKVESTLKADDTVTAAGTVTEALATSSGECLSINQISIRSKDKSEIILSPEMKLTITIEGRELLPGDRITVSGTFDAFDGATNPGQFDAASYYASLDTFGTLRNAAIQAVETGKNSLPRILASVRFSILGCYERVADEKTAAALGAICLGEKKMMEREQKQIYQDGGIAHILAVSGLHISMAGMGLFRLLRRFRLGYGTAAAASGAMAVLYTLLTGGAVSASRACVMFLLWLGAQFFGRKNDMLTAISVAAACLAGADWRNLTQSSFALSFSAVLSLCILPRAAEKSCGLSGKAAKTAAAGVSVWVGALPVTLWFFYQTAPWSILVNLAVIPLMSAVMASGLAAAAGLLWEPAGIFFAAPAGYLLEAFEALCRLEWNFPLPLWVAGRPGLFQIILFYAVLALLCLLPAAGGGKIQKTVAPGRRGKQIIASPGRRGKQIIASPGRHGIRLLWLFGCFFCIALMNGWGSKELEVTCLDVGQGDGALLAFPDGTNCLVDGGSSSNRKVWEYVISQSVKYYGVRQIDYWFLSHADEDHISGARAFLEEYETGRFGGNVHGIDLKHLVLPPSADGEDFDELKSLAQKNGIQVLRMDRGGAVGTDGEDGDKRGRIPWKITCLSPDKDLLSGDRNEDSMVLLLQYGSFRMLFTGDLEGKSEKRLAASGMELRADILKAGHHGSANASSEEFLEAVSPRFAVISCGENNRYGHPSEDAVGRLLHAGSEILRTDEGGAILVRTDGEQYSVEMFRQSRTGGDFVDGSET